jgi:hypothetical protein
MRVLGFVLLLLLWLLIVGVAYVQFGWWALVFATLGVAWPLARFKARKDAARKAAQADGGR